MRELIARSTYIWHVRVNSSSSSAMGGVLIQSTQFTRRVSVNGGQYMPEGSCVRRLLDVLFNVVYIIKK